MVLCVWRTEIGVESIDLTAEFVHWNSNLFEALSE